MHEPTCVGARVTVLIPWTICRILIAATPARGWPADPVNHVLYLRERPQLRDAALVLLRCDWFERAGRVSRLLGSSDSMSWDEWVPIRSVVRCPRNVPQCAVHGQRWLRLWCGGRSVVASSCVPFNRKEHPERCPHWFRVRCVIVALLYSPSILFADFRRAFRYVGSGSFLAILEEP